MNVRLRYILLTAALTSALRAPVQADVVARMGQLVSQTQARRQIGFTPFAPARRLIAIALIPPFSGDDVRANRGIAYEYVDSRGIRYALAEWPSRGHSIAEFPRLPANATTCLDAHVFSRGAKPNGIVWTTPRDIVLTLQLDGASDARMLESEWEKLIRRGACR